MSTFRYSAVFVTEYWKVLTINGNMHCVKSIRFRSFSGPYFPALRIRREYLSEFSPNPGKCAPEKFRKRTLSKRWWVQNVLKLYVVASVTQSQESKLSVSTRTVKEKGKLINAKIVSILGVFLFRIFLQSFSAILCTIWKICTHS